MNSTQSYLFLILAAYLALGYFYPAVGLLAIICMIAPVITAPFKGRQWCGNYCPRGSLYDGIIAKLSPHKPIPSFLRTTTFRTFMLILIMSVFSLQMYFAWGNINAMGFVFLRIIFFTTVVGIAMGVIYHERTWCSFCPMGTMAGWFSGRNNPLTIAPTCKGCQLCDKTCPMQLHPSSGKPSGLFYHKDCLKCSRCVEKCPIGALRFKADSSRNIKVPYAK